ncbi:LADA_0E05468g1_1 [Lachancea dasiensis]|uniref:Potassium transport protein n=1 Tax=Lachancea dasiensis TaxID=1072105 RepID=A0A1G4JC30_9SACH|nr:LADA_0E05468g1_1 [Lachancea dasiensis]
MQAWKTLSRRPTIASINTRYQKTLGHKLRDLIDGVANLIDPWVRHIFPNFIAIHYFYIIAMTIITSILMYPVKNYPFIDILFSAAGACTQGGLNTINTNEMTLYQQLVIYIACCFTTPIWIHGGLAFVRLYWFERYFDGIRDWSKKNFKMRRTKTLIQREMTSTGTGAQARVSSKMAPGDKNSIRNTDFQSKLFSGQMINREENPTLSENHEMTNISGGKENHPESFQKKEMHTSSSTGSTKSVEQPDDTPGIKFGAMPKPQKNADQKSPAVMEQFSGRRRSQDISPADMFRSIAMLRNRHVVEEREESGPALVINGPAERRIESITGLASPTHSDSTVQSSDGRKESVPPLLTNGTNSAGLDSSSSSGVEGSKPVTWSPENDQGRTIPSSIQFEENRPPVNKKPSERTLGKIPSKRRPKGIAKLARSGKLREKIRRFRSDNGDEDNDADTERDSSPSEHESEDRQDFLDSESRIDSGLSFDNIPNIEKVQSNLAIPSRDATGGSKFYKRSHTMEPQGNGNLELLTKSPSFQRMIYDKWKEDRRGKGRFLRSNNKSKLNRSYSDFNDSKRSGASIDWPSNDEEEMGDYLRMSFEQPTTRQPPLKRMSTNYLSWQPKIGRNSTFVGLSDLQRAELGGVEYRAIKLLCKLLLIYYLGFHILGFVMLLPWITHMKTYIELLRSDGISPAWWGFFTSMSAFNDLGITLTPDSMFSFNTAIYPLVTMMWFIVIGNTGFPIFLRFIIWALFKVSPELSLLKESLGFLLDHPRRCFTLLFPSAPTWWLLFILVALNAIDLILFIVLDLHAKVVEGLSSGFKILDGLFQAVSTRTAGFSVLNLSLLHPSIQVSYMLMMYVSVLPLAISIRRTNVYEEQSLGIYEEGRSEGKDEEDAVEDQEKRERRLDSSTKSFIGAHLRRQLSFDLWFLFLGLFIICISEGGKIQDPKKPDFTVFQVLFEIVSAYGTVGLSLGYPDTDQSFSAQFNTFSKLIIIAMLIRGRHRGLPYTLDRAILLPSQNLEHRDQIEDRKSERGLQSSDPLVAYLRKQSRSAKGQLRSMLHPQRSRYTDDDATPSLRSSVDYHSSAMNSTRTPGLVSPRSSVPDTNSHVLDYRGSDDNSRLSDQAPDAQENVRARVVP